jgi:hypothetical protein
MSTIFFTTFTLRKKVSITHDNPDAILDIMQRTASTGTAMSHWHNCWTADSTRKQQVIGKYRHVTTVHMQEPSSRRAHLVVSLHTRQTGANVLYILDHMQITPSNRPAAAAI